MAQIVVTIPDDQLTRVIDALAAHWHYELEKEEGETKGQFVKRALLNRLKREVLAQEALDAERQVHTDFVDPGLS
jgi:hypothetical protein